MVMNHTVVINSYHPSYSYRSYSASEICYYYVVNALRSAILCEKVITLTSSGNNRIKPTIDWNVWGDNKVYGINIQYPILPKTRIGIESFYTESNKLCIYLSLWWNVNDQVITEIFGETHKWHGFTINGEKTLLEEVYDTNSDEIARKVSDWHEKLIQWMIKD